MDDIVNKYNGLISVSTLRKVEKSSLKCDKALLDIRFLLSCKRFSVLPKFINFSLPYRKHNDEIRSDTEKTTSECDK